MFSVTFVREINDPKEYNGCAFCYTENVTKLCQIESPYPALFPGTEGLFGDIKAVCDNCFTIESEEDTE